MRSGIFHQSRPAAYAAAFTQAFVYETFLAKSGLMLFVNESLMTILHYFISIVLLLAIAFCYGISSRRYVRVRDRPLLAIVVAIFSWIVVLCGLRDRVMYELAVAAALFFLAWVCIAALPALLSSNLPPILFASIKHASSVVVLASALFIFWPPYAPYDEDGRFFGACGNVAVASTVFLVCALAHFAAWVASQKARFSLILWLAGSALVAMTQSRAAVLGLCFGTAVAMARGRRHLSVRSAMFACVSLLILLSSAIYFGMEADRRAELVTFVRLQSGDPFDTRKLNWTLAAQRIHEAPVAGYGLLSRHATADSLTQQLTRGSTGYSQLMDPHNVILFAAQVGGVTLASLVVALVVLLSQRVITAIRSPVLTHEPGASFAAAYCAAYVASGVGSGLFFTFGNYADRIFYLSVSIMVIVYAAALQERCMRRSAQFALESGAAGALLARPARGGRMLA